MAGRERYLTVASFPGSPSDTYSRSGEPVWQPAPYQGQAKTKKKTGSIWQGERGILLWVEDFTVG